ncbi:MAG: hypothetical protein BWY72_01976 [Bacteroidetes bacterium ADurb.Bin416]|nr:MAG: hypothetical protein BWY72_01976 [Bacteroidetes bacterium ADurb.Bin416]
MVGNDTHGDIGFGLFSIGQLAAVGNGLDDGLENVGVVVGQLALDGHTETFETHARVNMTGRQQLKGTVGFAVVLHEHVVPDFNNQGMALVNQGQSVHLGSFGLRPDVNVNL